MTGRDLIVYILTNNLENEPVFLDNGFFNLLSEGEAAEKLDVGLATIRTWIELGMLKGVRVGDKFYILPNW